MENDIEKLSDEAPVFTPPPPPSPAGTHSKPRGRKIPTEKKMSVAERMKATKALGGPKVKVQLKIPEALADIICTLAEKWHQEYYKVAVQCMIQGARAYTELPPSLDNNPFMQPLRKNPDLIDAMDQMRVHQRQPAARAMVEQLLEEGSREIFAVPTDFEDPFMPQTGATPQALVDKKFARPMYAQDDSPAAPGTPTDDEIDLMNAELEQENA